MNYIGIDEQVRKNNFNSLLLLVAFPVLLLGMIYVFIFFINGKNTGEANALSIHLLPFVLGAVGLWFLIAWTGNTQFIRWATGAKPLERTANKRVYNLVENLCIQEGMPMPKVFVIEDDSLNAFASGINNHSYSISLSRGIISKLSDEELEGVIAHELSHIRNRDTRLLIVSIIFVGIFSFLAEMAFRSIRFAGGKSGKDSKGSGAVILIAIVITAIAYLISLLLRFGISRKREYMADASASEMTKKPYALANALRKISADPAIEAVESRDVAQLFIDNPTPSIHRSASWDNMFSTHPDIQKRIALLEQFV
jgi:heat shock protein HtpX